MSTPVIPTAESADPRHGPTANAWTRHTGPDGQWLLAPLPWRVTAAGRTQELTVSEPGGAAAALVRQREAPLHGDVADWLWRQYPGTEPGLHQVHMRRLEALPAQAACALFDYGSPIARCRASALVVRHGRQATVFVAASVQSRHAELLPVMVRILDSCRPCPGGIAPAARRALLARLLRLGKEAEDP
jgi:hypothetical protein